jgi:hypothetical protein
MRRRWLTSLALLAPVTPGVSQTQTDSSADLQRVRAVEIRAHDIFPPEEAKGLIARLSNGLHITTRPGIVRRELLIRPGDRYDSARVAETERNLRALRLFRRVRIDSVRTDSGLVVRVTTQDAFSTRADARLKVSGGSRTWSVAVDELNLFGTGTRLGVRYRKTPDRSAVLTQFQRQRLFDNRVGVTALYDDRSDGRMVYGALDQPFFSLSSRSSWYLSGEERDERVLRFYEGNATARDTLSRRYWLGGAGLSFAPSAGPGGYVRWGIAGQVRRDDYALERQEDTLAHTVTAAVGGYVQWRAARFLVSSGFEGFGREEDVDLSTLIHLGLYLTPKAFGYREDGIVPNFTARTGLGWRGGFARVGVTGQARITDAGVIDSGSVHLGSMVVLKPSRRQMAVLHASQGWQTNAAPGAEFDLGLDVGPRGFQAHAFTGDRAFFLTAEYRYTLTDNFLRSAGLGLAAFGDYGGAWYRGSPRRTGYAVGVGVRFGLTLATDLEPVRVDLARIGGSGIDKGRWEIAIGKGFVFNPTGRLDR